MSNNQMQSSIGRVNYRAITITEAKTIILEALRRSISKALGNDKPLTFHAFRLRYGFKIEALTGTPIPPEVDKILTFVAPDFTDEELDALNDRIEILKEKRQEFVNAIAKIDNYLAKAEVEYADIGSEDDNRTPDILRQKYDLPIMQVQQNGPQVVEMPIPDNSKIVSPTNESFDFSIGDNRDNNK